MGIQVKSRAEQIKSVGFAHSAATVAKTLILVNAKVMLPLNTADAAAANVFVYEAEIYGAPKATGTAWAPGDPLYWDDTAKKLTETSASNTLCGYALEAAASGDTTGGLVAFNSFA